MDFRNLLTQQSVFLRPYAFSLTQNFDDANDLFQETMMRALLNQEKYQSGTNLKAWLYTIMRNIFINNYRKSKKIKLATDREIPTETYMYRSGNTARNEGWSNLRVREVTTAIATLPSACRVSFELHYTGYKYQEIADILKEPIGTIKSRIHIARKTLISCLEQ